MIDVEQVRRMALSLPEATEREAWGTPAFRVKDKIFARMLEDGRSLAIKAPEDERWLLSESEPDTYSVPPHYRNYSMMVVRLSRIDPDSLKAHLIQAWRLTAPKRLVAAYHAEG
ncbi:MmcQ/YjbR family DNA-binding protein [Paenibacillus sp. GYB003]|jgi:hypothetical protein|uniref:MmcQ/YjbR family DNA-binding protein n=1 Tax=Paenibacillus sp. GYB003 TaxID=2994392 RepID=UPI002F96371B